MRRLPLACRRQEVGSWVRTVGGVAAVSGLGLAGYAVFMAAAGPLGWAAGLLFFGGLSAYLAQRRLDGEQDFPPTGTKAGRG